MAACRRSRDTLVRGLLVPELLLKNPVFDVQPLQGHLIFEIYGIAKAMS
jgi:hypothetical protein